MTLRRLLGILATALIAWIGMEAASAQTYPYVGMISRAYVDDTRQNWERTGPRPLATTVWYPAPSASFTIEIFGGSSVFVPMPVAPGAPLAQDRSTFPLVIISHGTGGAAVQHLWLARYLVARGYIVAAVNHHGNTVAESDANGNPKFTPQGFRLFWERARDIKPVLNRLIGDPLFGPRIDMGRIYAAGFSQGGYTTIAAAGGFFSQEEYEAFCKSSRRDFTCEPQPEFPEAQALFDQMKATDPVIQESLRHDSDYYGDSRIRRVFSMAPAMAGGIPSWGLNSVYVPVKIVVGSGDAVAPVATNAQVYASRIRGSSLTLLPEASHYTFLTVCTNTGKQLMYICKDPAGTDRIAFHDKINRMAYEFFETGR